MGERGGISGEVQTARVAAGGGGGGGEGQEEEIHGREEVLLKAGRRR